MNNTQKKSMLPNIYPEHFKQQMPLILNSPPYQEKMSFFYYEDSCSSLESSYTIPGLQDYIEKPLFENAGISQFLEMNDMNDFYQLHPQHIAYLAEILKVDFEYLNNLVKLLSRTDPNLVPNINAMENRQFFESTFSKDGNRLVKNDNKLIDEDTEVISNSQNVFNV